MNAVVRTDETLSLSELYVSAAESQEFYCRQFFPKTFRQETPKFHLDFWAKLEDPSKDFFGAEMFRGAGKTTLSRTAISRRVAFASSRNILAVAISEIMAVHTLRWLKKQIENNTLWTDTFKLSKGSKWSDDWIEIYHGIEDCFINVLAKGMTSGLRGLNLDDWRPDFIYCDDICNEENTGTPEQLAKTNDHLFGALVPGLAPKSEAPTRKLVLTNTCLKEGDPISMAHKDPMFHTVKYPILYTDHQGQPQSSWPERFPIAAILKDKDSYTNRRQAHVWQREYECKIISKETAAFDVNWLKSSPVLPTQMIVALGVDPARATKKHAHKTALCAVGYDPRNHDTHILESYAQKGKNPLETWVQLKEMYRRWRPRLVGVESIAYQAMLAWFFRQQMQAENFFFPITEIQDRRAKPDRIRQAYTGLASSSKLYVPDNNLEFRQEFSVYTDNVDSDLLDAGAIAICMLNPWMVEGYIDADNPVEDAIYDESHIPDNAFEVRAP